MKKYILLAVVQVLFSCDGSLKTGNTTFKSPAPKPPPDVTQKNLCKSFTLSGHQYCNVAKKQDEQHLKVMSFKEDCSLYFAERNMRDNSLIGSAFVGTWVLEGQFLTVRSDQGSSIRELIFTNQNKSIAFKDLESEVFNQCD